MPTSTVGMQKMIKQVKQQQHHQISNDLNQLIHVGENLVLDKEILLIENRQLQQALNQERRHHKHGRIMGLLDSSNPSLAQFFSPAKMQHIREQMTASEAVKKNEQACKEDAKLQHTLFKKQKKTDIMKQWMQQNEQLRLQELLNSRLKRSLKMQERFKKDSRTKRGRRTSCCTAAITVE
ncbi:predicted protein [Histoplasma mississippiense (nom. inval.)]|uniref:predicted protein n=1 Tax=Ajellomyces capsulatus (strain NAm1 / WU24) TaxID=2059318 RepID=UPI000157C4B8|nr:predicted protein [Histoplasma mississippiense (nom. inval.)]EDN08499.1 predicted protein [Histoplasma mississippiense (nom. inval.)]